MNINKIYTNDDFEKLARLQKATWGMSDSDCLPAHILTVCEKLGGLILGCYAGTDIIGFSFSLPGIDKNRKTFHYLHELGILPHSQSKNIGYMIMQKHKELSLQQGIEMIQWTFDPLESKNANLYIRKLGAEVVAYLPNYYGSKMEGMNSQIDSDRFLVNWNISGDNIKYRNDLSKKGSPNNQLSDFVILSPTSFGNNQIEEAAKYAIEIPYDYQRIKDRDLKQAYLLRKNTAQIFKAILKINKQIVDFICLSKEQVFYLTD